MRKNLTYMLLVTIGIICLAILGITTSFVFGLAGAYFAVGSVFALSYALEVPEIFQEDSDVSAFSFFITLAPLWLFYLIARTSQRAIEMYRRPSS